MRYSVMSAPSRGADPRGPLPPVPRTATAEYDRVVRGSQASAAPRVAVLGPAGGAVAQPQVDPARGHKIGEVPLRGGPGDAGGVGDLLRGEGVVRCLEGIPDGLGRHG